MKTVFEIAGYIAKQANWQFSNLQLQKLVYLCQMFHMGHLDKEPLFHDDFEAWDYGPVVPSLYHELKMFGAKSVAHYCGLPVAKFAGESDDKAKNIVDQLIAIGRNATPGQLIGYTHRAGGAWARHYIVDHNVLIPKLDILAEYETLYRKKRDSATTSN